LANANVVVKYWVFTGTVSSFALKAASLLTWRTVLVFLLLALTRTEALPTEK